jgi:hypothetical protein
MVGGMALGASAANASDAALWTVTGGGPAIDGSFEYTSSSELGITPGGNEFLSAFDGTGAYAGINEFSLTSLAGEGYPTEAYQFFSNGVNYVITAAVPAANATSYVGSVVGTSASYTISAAPEPGVWLLMIAGVAMIGSALRFSRKQGALALA